jgi:acrylyl-CoA reductase (NADPH)
MFKALLLNQQDKKTSVKISHLDEDTLPEGDVLVDISYSSINYKDALAVTGKGRIIRNFPMVPGIDFVGKVIESKNSHYEMGDEVILTGWGVGENHWGGLAEKAKVKAQWLVPLPKTLTPQKAMIIGTAGLTAMLCVQSLIDNGLTPEKGDVLVTGASGGVGSVAVTLLNELGYKVTAVTGRLNENEALLKSLGATSVLDRNEFTQKCRPLEKQRWAGVVDTVGSQILANILTQVQYDGRVAMCGLAAGFDLPTSVMPFILRGVSLLGIDSVACPYEKRVKAWQQLAELLPQSYYSQASKEITLEEVAHHAEQLIDGKITGRLLVKI